MSTQTIATLTALRHSLSAALNCEAIQPMVDDHSYLEGHNRGMRAGLDLAIRAIDREIDMVNIVVPQVDLLRKHPQPVDAPSSTFRIEVSPEELAQRERDIAAGTIPF